MGQRPKLNFWNMDGHVTYQIKENEAYSTMIANILPAATPWTPGVRSKGQNFFSESSRVAYQIKGNGV